MSLKSGEVRKLYFAKINQGNIIYHELLELEVELNKLGYKQPYSKCDNNDVLIQKYLKLNNQLNIIEKEEDDLKQLQIDTRNKEEKEIKDKIRELAKNCKFVYEDNIVKYKPISSKDFDIIFKDYYDVSYSEYLNECFKHYKYFVTFNHNKIFNYQETPYLTNENIDKLKEYYKDIDDNLAIDIVNLHGEEFVDLWRWDYCYIKNQLFSESEYKGNYKCNVVNQVYSYDNKLEKVQAFAFEDKNICIYPHAIYNNNISYYIKNGQIKKEKIATFQKLKLDSDEGEKIYGVLKKLLNKKYKGIYDKIFKEQVYKYGLSNLMEADFCIKDK